MRRPTNYVSLSRTKSSVSPHRDENITSQQSQLPPQCKSPPPTPSLKESRAFEHDRQRLKKAAALLARSARKAGAKTKVQTSAKPQQQQTIRRSVGQVIRADDLGQDELGVEESEVEWGEARSLSLRVGVPDDTEWERERGGSLYTRRAEVALRDLLIARKPRRGHDQDFEVVPPIRSVIVLDDMSAPELDLDEPWEHVYASDTDDGHTCAQHRTELSYAKIVALS